MDVEVLMNADELWDTVGKMLARNQRQKVKPDEVKRKFDAYVRDLAAGRTAIDLSVEEVFELGEPDTSEEHLPQDVAELLGMKEGASYGAIFESMN
jgi:hypothetical protein